MLDAYVTTEFGYVGARCRHGIFHLDESIARYRVEKKHLLVSSDFNEAMPMSEYDVGDMVEPYQANSCRCLQPGFLIKHIAGRSLPNFVIDQKKVSPSALMHAFKRFPKIQEYQLTQLSRDEFQLRIQVSGLNTDFPLESFIKFICTSLGAKLNITTEFSEKLHDDKFQRFRVGFGVF